MELNTIYIQGIGIIACVLGTASFLYKNDKILKYLMSIAAFIFSIHYFLLDSWTAGTIKLINSFRNLLSIRFSSKYLILFFLSLYWSIGIYFAKETIDYISIITITISTISMFTLNGVMLRIMFLPSIITWIFVGIHNNSIGGVIAESLVLISNLSTIIRITFQDKNITKSILKSN
jgi:hypothetical protein